MYGRRFVAVGDRGRHLDQQQVEMEVVPEEVPADLEVLAVGSQEEGVTAAGVTVEEKEVAARGAAMAGSAPPAGSRTCHQAGRLL